VLGHHPNGGNNQANTLLYGLSKNGFDELKCIPNHGEVTFPDFFFENLKKRGCIEILTHALMIQNDQLMDNVWKSLAF